MTRFFYVLVLVVYWCQTGNSQNRYDSSSIKSGYRGNYIRHLEVPDKALNFIVVGDWGRCGEYYQKEVATQMAGASVSGNVEFLISTGDNFYPNGVASVDDPLWEKSFENVYFHHALQKEWYVVLGNHDYRTNAQAEIEYTKKSARWNLPARYYSEKMPIGGDTNQKVLFVFIDTSPFIEKYYSDAVYGKAVRTQDTAAQKKWLQQTLSDPDPAIKWKIAVGHHPLYTSGKRIDNPETLQFRKSMEQIFRQNAVDAYLCGHEHQLEYIKPEGKTHYFISGAGSEVRPVNDQLPGSRFKASDHGFMLFSLTASDLKMQVINWEGKILYKQTAGH